MILSRRVYARATRIALIAASVPELTKRTRSSDGIRRCTCSPSSCSSGDGAPKLVPRRAGDRLHQSSRRVAVNQRPPRHHVVDEAVAVDVLNDRARAALDEQRRSADGVKGANRAVNSAGQDLAGPSKELLRTCRILHARSFKMQ